MPGTLRTPGAFLEVFQFAKLHPLLVVGFGNQTSVNWMGAFILTYRIR